MAKLMKPLQQVNKYKVSKTQWKKWCDLAQRTFNQTHGILLANQSLFLHPGQDPVRAEYWKTTAWNAAWEAAEAVTKGLDDIVAGKGYARVK